MAQPIQAVIWDLDGVIIDSAEEHRQAWLRMAREEGFPMSDADFWATFGKRNDDIMTILWGALPPERIKAMADKKEVYFRELARQTARPLPGSMELMRGLHSAHSGEHDRSASAGERSQIDSSGDQGRGW